METINLKTALLAAEINIDEIRPSNTEKASQFVAYHYKNGETINVESTARQMMAEMLCLPMDVQAQAVMLIAQQVKNPGDQAIIEGGDHRRGARVVRLASDDASVHNLLLTF